MALERDTILAALRQTDGNISKAARLLHASRRTLQNRMREYDMPEGTPGRRHQRLPYRGRSSAGGALAALGGLAAVVVGGVVLSRRRPA